VANKSIENVSSFGYSSGGLEETTSKIDMTASIQCISFEDLAELTREEVEQVAKAAGNYNPASDAGAFPKQVRSLESLVTTSYKLAVRLAKRTTDLNELCEIWKSASEICDSILQVMKSLKDSRPECGTPQLYDLVLDYKNAAFKRYQQNLEALQWETTPPPAGLFPKSN
jgi:hypothetical protein